MMIDPQHYLSKLKECDIDFFVGVPDSLLKEFCACVSYKCGGDNHLITANEGAAIGYGIGYHLGTGKLPMIYLQNSGFGNIVNPVLSLASKEVYSVPMLIMVGWRGEPGVRDEPQHIHQGRVLEQSLEAMDLPFLVLENDENQAFNQTEEAVSLAKELSSPVFILVRKNTFSKYQIDKRVSDLELSRETAVITAAGNIPDEALIICTTGMPSRELYEYRSRNGLGHHRDFLTVGGMGHASQIALGLSKTVTNKPIFCFDGDGASLMHLGSLGVIGQSKASNLTHIIFNNGVHDSVGGQPTVGFDIDFCAIASACGYNSVTKVTSIQAIKDEVNFSLSHSGPNFIEIQVKPGSRKDIGRPTSSPIENKTLFMENIGVKN